MIMGDKMDMALDDIIKTTKGASRGRGGRSVGASGGGLGRGSARGGRGSGGRGSGGASRGSISNGAGRNTMTTGRWSHNMYLSQGGSAGRMVPQSMAPVKLNISNLDYGVTDLDIKELFQEFGYMRKAAVHYDRSGCSLGRAQVLFERRSDALKAMQQYNGVHLDGRLIEIFLEGDAGAGGMRGGRMGGASRGPMVKGPQGSRPEPLIPRLGGGRGGRSGSRVGRGGGGRGGRGGKGDGGDKAKPKTAEELYAELDNYLCEAKKTKT